MHTTCVNSKDNAKSSDSDHIFVIRNNTRLKHKCPFLAFVTGDGVADCDICNEINYSIHWLN